MRPSLRERERSELLFFTSLRESEPLLLSEVSKCFGSGTLMIKLWWILRDWVQFIRGVDIFVQNSGHPEHNKFAPLSMNEGEKSESQEFGIRIAELWCERNTIRQMTSYLLKRRSLRRNNEMKLLSSPPQGWTVDERDESDGPADGRLSVGHRQLERDRGLRALHHHHAAAPGPLLHHLLHQLDQAHPHRRPSHPAPHLFQLQGQPPGDYVLLRTTYCYPNAILIHRFTAFECPLGDSEDKIKIVKVTYFLLQM